MSGGVCFCKDGWHFHAKSRRKDATGGFSCWTAQLLLSLMFLFLFIFFASLVKCCRVPAQRQRTAAHAAPCTNRRETLRCGYLAEPAAKIPISRPDCNRKLVQTTASYSSSSSPSDAFMRIEETFHYHAG